MSIAPVSSASASAVHQVPPAAPKATSGVADSDGDTDGSSAPAAASASHATPSGPGQVDVKA